jgi:methyltransferase-like protein
MDTAAYTIALKNEEAVLDGRPDLYLVHEHLERDNLPVYFHEFVEQASSHGLQYLAEANFFTMHPSNFPSFAQDEIKRLGLGLIETEQYLDFLRNRSFRQTLLCHSEIALERDLRPARLKSMYVGSPMVPVTKEGFNLKSEAPEQFVAPNDVVVSVSSPLAKAVLLHLHETWPAWTQFEDLLVRAHYRLDPKWLPVQSAEQVRNDSEALGDMLLRFFVADTAELHVQPTPYVGSVSERPVASPLARYLAANSQHVVNLRHETITLDSDVSRFVLRNLDGARDRAALLALLEGLVADGTLVVQSSNGQAAGEAAAAHPQEVLAEALDRALQLLARTAILIQ